MVALHVIKTLQNLDYKVSIVTDNYEPSEVERYFRMGKIMEECDPVQVPAFKPVLSRFLALQQLAYARRLMRLLRSIKADLAFSTQSILYYIPEIMTFHIVYDMADLFEVASSGYALGPLARVWKKPYYMILRRLLHTGLKSNRLFVPLSHALEQQLASIECPHSAVVFPPCDMIFRPRRKKKQVCLVSRIAPQKNIGDFMRIARKLPKRRFLLVGIHAEKYQNYAREVLSTRPQNVEYVRARIRDRPELVEESKVYLYTSTEPGIGIALGQAMGAGCVPVTPAWGGGSEMLSAAKVGYVYRNIDEAKSLVEKSLDSEEHRDNPEVVASRSMLFSSENFEKKLAGIIQNSS